MSPKRFEATTTSSPLVPDHPSGERVDEYSLVAHAGELDCDLVGDSSQRT